MYHNQSDHCSHKTIPAKNGGCRDCDQHRKKLKRCVCKQIQDRIPVACRKSRTELRQQLHDSGNQPGGNNRGKQRHKHFSDRLKYPADRERLFFPSDPLDLLLSGIIHSADLQKLVKYFIYGTRTNNNLKLSAAYEHTFYSFDPFQRPSVCPRIVCRHKPQTRRAVRYTPEIFPSPDFLKNLLRTGSIIKIFFLLFHPL